MEQLKFRRQDVGRFAQGFCVHLGIEEFAAGKHNVNGRQHHPGNQRFLVATLVLECFIALAVMGKRFVLNRCQSTLNHDRFDVNASAADFGGFLLPGTLVIRWRQPAQEHKCLADLNWDISALISDRITSADK